MLLSACAVGPAWQRPSAPAVSSYIAPGATATGTVAAPVLQSGAAVDPQWWRAFGSAPLDQLVDASLAHNPDIAAAQATVEQAEHLLRATRGAFYPQVALGLGAERQRSSGAASGGIAGPRLYNLYTGQVEVGYTPHVFGLSRLATRDAQARVDVARYQLAAARLAIAGNVVATTIDLSALDAQVDAMQRTLRDQQQVLDLARTQYHLGATSQFDVLAQESLYASSQAQLVTLQQARDQAWHLLATYTGKFPAQAGELPIPAIDALQLPAQLPLSLPSALVRERPDILAAEAQLRAANAEVGVAVARMYPNVQLSAAWGVQGNHGDGLFGPASRIWDVAAGVVQPIFEGGTLKAEKQAAEAAYRGVFANYQSTVLGAFRNVADVLRALDHDAGLLDAQTRALRDAQQANDLVAAQYRAGGVDYLRLMTSETQLENARIAHIKAQAQRYADTTALYVALGGGQWPAATAQAAVRQGDQ
jgi:NodT family efflux transporter outer membrane factor (OMF) lipoprotein